MASNSNQVVDFKWMPFGGLLVDSCGDISFTGSSAESIEDMIATRLMASIDAWKSYRIGADLDNLIGNTVDDELEITIQKQVTQSLTNQFLSIDSLVVTTLDLGNTIDVYVYYQGKLVATTTVTN